MIVKCETCNKETKNPKFCSRSCSAIYTNKHTKRKRLKPNQKTLDKYGSCMFCSTKLDYKLRRTVCDNCFAPDYSLRDIQYDKHHKSSAWALIRSRSRSVIKSRPKVCQGCGYDKHVECCHIKPISSFSLDSKLSEVNHPDNLILLCPNCHWEFDNGLYKL